MYVFYDNSSEVKVRIRTLGCSTGICVDSGKCWGTVFWCVHYMLWCTCCHLLTLGIYSIRWCRQYCWHLCHRHVCVPDVFNTARVCATVAAMVSIVPWLSAKNSPVLTKQALSQEKKKYVLSAQTAGCDELRCPRTAGGGWTPTWQLCICTCCRIIIL